uniref:Uncharacterized protein n=1 Tax=Haptolina brevifila TaxID=156173 RepID=A0A7S2I5I3_9EUKA
MSVVTNGMRIRMERAIPVLTTDLTSHHTGHHTLLTARRSSCINKAAQSWCKYCLQNPLQSTSRTDLTSGGGKLQPHARLITYKSQLQCTYNALRGGTHVM